ncbi:MAG: T9SS type A sorting domain-containing protein [Lewinellaceae bacterium]|nr:T9SS type A sorting domain-containing protein [Lewinellaceae bacterium]
MLYPNPSSGLFLLSVQSPQTIEAEIRVFDVLGAAVYRSHASGTEWTREIDLSTQMAGVYFVEISLEGQTYLEKIVLVK